MKFAKHLALVVAAVSLVGCNTLLPKKVEFFQDKVQAFPERKNWEKEVERKAAFRASEKAKETLLAAVQEGSTPSVVKPATETAALTEAVSLSVGPPKNAAPNSVSSEALALELRSAVAALNARIDEFKKDNNENVGKKIEDTGIFKIGYFSMWAIIIGFFAILWVALKVYGMVNPVVGLGVNVVGRVSSSLLKKGISEVTEGGEWFKDELKKTGKEVLSKEEILEMFQRNHLGAQSRDVQTLVERLTQK